MKQKSLLILSSLVLFAVCYSFREDDKNKLSRKKSLDLAKSCIEENYFEKAETTYKQYLQRDTNDYEFYYELGMLEFVYLAKKDSAIKYLEKYILHNKNKKDTLPEVCSALGQSYQYAENYDKALSCYRSFRKRLKSNQGGKTIVKGVDIYVEECLFAKDNLAMAKGVTVTNVGSDVNTPFPEFNPVGMESDSYLFFTSLRYETNAANPLNDEEAFPRIYVATKKQGKFTNTEHYGIFDNLLLGSSKVQMGSISYKNNLIFISKDERIYTATGKDTTWTVPEMMNDSINSSYSQNNAFLTADEQTLYFSSNSIKGYGGLDLYKCKKDKNGNWGSPVNLGPTINTAGDEEGPSVSSDGKTLYFSSTGFFGFGGFDLFKSKINDTAYASPENMGRPYNSPADDVFLKFNKAGNQAYFSSGRINGFGDMDIYKVTIAEEAKHK